jgi:ribonucleoside-diphosphate reductase alpha chain
MGGVIVVIADSVQTGQQTNGSSAAVQSETTRLEGVREKVFLDRYALKDRDGKATETAPEDMWRRVAKGIAAVEPTPEKQAYWTERFYEALSDFKFVPGGRILAGAGTGTAVTYYNCYVIPSPEDSRGGILDNLKVMVDIMARGGGVGINLSSLRPRGSYIKTVNGTSSGPISWAELYSVATKDVIQQGGSRRGALMLMLDDDHPDIEEFITVKQDLQRINGANLSVCVSDAFMAAVKQDRPWQLKWQGEVKKELLARELWELICEAAWASGEPGMVFIDRYNKVSNTWYYEDIICVNPCGEQGLPAWGVCNLGALNVAAFVRDGEMDYDALAEHAKVAIRFLDDVVDANEYFIPENRKAQLGTRRTGLGTMGLADALIKMELRYGQEESLPVIERVYRTIRDAAYECSAALAVEKGPFPSWDQEKYAQGVFIEQLPAALQEQIAETGTRNAVLLTQAPTGSTSLLSGVSSGIEPVYDFAFVRRDRIGEHVIYHSLLQDWKEAHPDAETPPWFVSANDLTPEDHVRVQALVQQYTDSSISKTVNAPNSHTIDDVKTLYTLAYDLGCKGITYFRDGCREGVLSHIEEPDKPAEEQQAEAEAVQLGLNGLESPPQVKPRPRAMHGVTYRKPTPLGTAFVTVNHNGDERPFEVFTQVGKAGSDTAADAEAMGRLISIILRLPSSLSPVERLGQVVDQLSGIGGGRSMGLGPQRVRSLPDGIAQVLSEYLAERQPADGDAVVATNGAMSEQPMATNGHRSEAEAFARPGDLCPQCGVAALIHEEGCQKCYSCGYSEC